MVTVTGKGPYPTYIVFALVKHHHGLCCTLVGRLMTGLNFLFGHIWKPYQAFSLAERTGQPCPEHGVCDQAQRRELTDGKPYCPRATRWVVDRRSPTLHPHPRTKCKTPKPTPVHFQLPPLTKRYACSMHTTNDWSSLLSSLGESATMDGFTVQSPKKTL